MGTTSSTPTFEIGLSLAGGVSCGAYTAGAVDFLVEALDAWRDALAQGAADAPQHDVRVVAIGGASSGALTAAVLASVLPFELQPVREDTAADEAARNPLYDSWVNITGLEDLLGTADAREGGVRSLLDPTPVERAARKAVQHDLAPRARTRSWLADPVRLLFSVSDLHGLRLAASPQASSDAPAVTEHAVMLRFAIGGVGDVGSAPPPRPDETVIDHRAAPLAPQARWAAWGKDLADVALASGAVPGALPVRHLVRPWSMFEQQELVLPGCRDAPPRVVVLRPRHGAATNGLRRFDAVDGGLVDNTALHAVRAELNQRDLLSCNAREADSADRAVLLIDPMLDSGGLHAPDEVSNGGALAQVAKLGRLLLDQVRAGRADIALGLDDTVYSRFLISPGREQVNSGGCAALAGASLGGFGGYLARDFRRHDYLLGRRNAQQALAAHLTLPASHPLFGRWTDAQRARYCAGAQGELPLIPLVGRLHPVHGVAEDLPKWPKLRVDPAQFGPHIDRRLQALFCAWPQVALRLIAYLPWRLLVRPKLRRMAVRAIGSGLRRHGLQ